MTVAEKDRDTLKMSTEELQREFDVHADALR
jgi:hypothetical protein